MSNHYGPLPALDRTPNMPIYLDNQATTPTDPRVVAAMLPWFSQHFGNPHSRSHAYGWESEAAVDVARQQVAELIGADAKEIVFTSGATEANNLALKGVMQFYGKEKNHLITLVTEHKCVLDSCRHLEQEGYKVTYLPVQENGLVDLALLASTITDQTALVSIMGANNEIGVIQPLAEIGALCRSKGVFFHSDCAQAVGKIPLDVNAMKIDLMSISAHKIYGPKGIGALYVRRRPRVRVLPQINGGGQERGMRSGTLSPPLCVGFGVACAIAKEEMSEETKRLHALRDRLLRGLQSQLTDLHINGDMTHRLPGSLNISFAFVEGESLMMGVKDLAVSSGSACTSASLEPSYVLRALSLEDDLAHASLRFGIGRFNTEADIDTAVAHVVKAVNHLRSLSPLWEMHQDGIDIKKIEWAEH